MMAHDVYTTRKLYQLEQERLNAPQNVHRISVLRERDAARRRRLYGFLRGVGDRLLRVSELLQTPVAPCEFLPPLWPFYVHLDEADDEVVVEPTANEPLYAVQTRNVRRRYGSVEAQKGVNISVHLD